MRKTALAILIINFLLLLACSNENNNVGSATETVSSNYGKVIELAKDEFNKVFSEYKSLKIEETSTMVRTTDSNRIVIQMKYSSDNGSGVYGFEYKKDAKENYELIQQGEDVTIDNLINN